MAISPVAFAVTTLLFVVADSPLAIRMSVRALLIVGLLHTGAHLDATATVDTPSAPFTPLPDLARQCPVLASTNMSDVVGWGTVPVNKRVLRDATVRVVVEAVEDISSMSIMAAFRHVFVRRESAVGLFIGAVLLTGWP